MPPDFYSNSSDPADNTDAEPIILRAEHASIAAGFVKVAPYTGNANKFVVINAGATAQTVATAAEARTLAGLVIGTNVQAYSANLDAWAAITATLAGLGAAASGVNTDITSLSAPSLGAATATTAAANDSSTKVATTAFVAGAGFTTGDVKLTIKTVADSGWVLMDDKTIGDASSGATGRANADTSALYTLLWDNTVNGDCAVSTGRGANAAADFAAHKTIALPKVLGRALGIYGAGSGLTSRAMAKIVGEETHVLTTAELASHNHSNFTLDVTSVTAAGTSATASSASQVGVTSTTGSDSAHNNMQPTVFLNVMIKL